MKKKNNNIDLKRYHKIFLEFKRSHLMGLSRTNRTKIHKLYWNSVKFQILKTSGVVIPKTFYDSVYSISHATRFGAMWRRLNSITAKKAGGLIINNNIDQITSVIFSPSIIKPLSTDFPEEHSLTDEGMQFLQSSLNSPDSIFRTITQDAELLAMTLRENTVKLPNFNINLWDNSEILSSNLNPLMQKYLFSRNLIFNYYQKIDVLNSVCTHNTCYYKIIKNVENGEPFENTVLTLPQINNYKQLVLELSSNITKNVELTNQLLNLNNFNLPADTIDLIASFGNNRFVGILTELQLDLSLFI